MKNATILALQGPTGTDADLTPLIDEATRKNGRLSVVLIEAVPLLPSYSVGAAPYSAAIVPEGWVAARNAVAEGLKERQAATRALLQKHGLTGEVATICVEPGALHDMVAARAAFADLVVVQNSLRDNDVAFRNIIYGLLFEAAGPIVLNTETNDKALKPENVFIAWNNSLPAIRAVRAALPLLKAAKEVTIACFDPHMSQWTDGESPGSDLASWLSHHGCRVTVHEYPTGGQQISAAILDRAAERLADLIVMGAYGRSRLNERIFGGTTLSMLTQETMPVLMVH